MREGKIISSRFWAKTLAVEGTRRVVQEEKMKTRLVLLTAVMALVAFVAISSTSQTQMTDNKFVTAAPALEPVTTSAIVATGQYHPATLARSRGKGGEATCDNPDLISSRKVSEEERNKFLVEAMKHLPPNATADETAAFVAEVKASVPAEDFTRQVYVDDPSVGDPPNAKDDPDGAKFEEWVKKAKEAGCKATPFRPTGGRLAAPMAQYFTSGWKSCTNSTWTTNSVGATLIKLTQTSRWYVDSRGLPYYPSRSFYSYAGWGWDEKGSPQGQTGKVTIWYGVPLQYYNWTGQNFHFEHFGIELYTKYLRVDQYFGFQGRCGILPWWP